MGNLEGSFTQPQRMVYVLNKTVIMKKITLLITLVISSVLAYSQSFEIPKNYEFKTEADYDKYESDILACVDWLMTSPIHKEVRKRDKAVTFLAAYSRDNDRVNPYLDKKEFPFLLNGELGVIYIASWTKSCLTQNYVNNKEEFTLRATNQVIEYYLANQSKIKKGKGIQLFVNQKNQGNLASFVNSKL